MEKPDQGVATNLSDGAAVFEELLGYKLRA